MPASASAGRIQGQSFALSFAGDPSAPVTEPLDAAMLAELADLVDDATAALERFSKVMPTDYRKVLDIQEKARAEGRDPIDAVMEEMSRG